MENKIDVFLHVVETQLSILTVSDEFNIFVPRKGKEEAETFELGARGCLDALQVSIFCFLVAAHFIDFFFPVGDLLKLLEQLELTWIKIS